MAKYRISGVWKNTNEVIQSQEQAKNQKQKLFHF
jgi:hypothetical protein